MFTRSQSRLLSRIGGGHLSKSSIRTEGEHKAVNELIQLGIVTVSGEGMDRKYRANLERVAQLEDDFRKMYTKKLVAEFPTMKKRKRVTIKPYKVAVAMRVQYTSYDPDGGIRDVWEYEYNSWSEKDMATARQSLERRSGIFGILRAGASGKLPHGTSYVIQKIEEATVKEIV